jgi:asparagine synthase (glutamine-hydrolysing)
VVLSGEGADELFGGYPTYLGHKLASKYQRLPELVRRLLLQGTRLLTPNSMGNVGLDYLIERFLEGAEKGLVERHHIWFGCLSPSHHLPLFSPVVREKLILKDPFASARSCLKELSQTDVLSNALYMDFKLYLQDNLLTKIDRCTMLASL